MHDTDKIIKQISKNNLVKAKELCVKKLKKDNLSEEYNHLLAVIFYKQNRFVDARSQIEQVLQKQVKDPSIYNTAAQIFSTDNIDKAIQYQELAVEASPSSAHLTNLANLHLVNGTFKEAVLHARQAVLLTNAIPQAVSVLAQSLLSLGRFSEVVEVVEKYSINSLHDLIVKIKAMVYLNRFELALRELNKVVTSGRLSDTQFQQVISLLESLGEFDTRTKLLVSHESKSKYYATLFAIKNQANESTANNAEQYFQKTNSAEERVNLAFSIAKYYKNIDKEQWLNWLHISNKNKKSLITYDESKTLAYFNKAIENLRNAELPISTSTTDVPIFIFGMPRSGTTLVESIISAHNQCFPTGESYGLQQVLNAGYIKNYRDYSRLFECFSHLDDFTSSRLDEIAKQYLKWQRQYCKKAKRLIDKMPYNFIYAALLPKIFPNAKFIYVSRNPIANCLSIYEQNWGEMFGFSTDLKAISNYYKSYTHYMESTLLSEHSSDIYQLSYESLIESPETEIRNILKYCNLDFDKNCLNFNEQKRTITTASKEQVRNKIYSSSLKSWQGLENELDDLIKAFV